MNVDERGRAAAEEVRRAFTGTDRFGAVVEIERLHDQRLRRARHQRWRAGLVAAAITIAAIALPCIGAPGSVACGSVDTSANGDGPLRKVEREDRKRTMVHSERRWEQHPRPRHHGHVRPVAARRHRDPDHQRCRLLPGPSIAPGDRPGRRLRQTAARGDEGSIVQPRVRRRVARRPVHRARGLHR